MWWVYIIESQSGKFYTGVTKDINIRFRQHAGEIKGGAKFFRSDPPCILVYLEKQNSRSSAQSREYAIKRLHRRDKELLIY